MNINDLNSRSNNPFAELIFKKKTWLDRRKAVWAGDDIYANTRYLL
jgi:hypothetical protein